MTQPLKYVGKYDNTGGEIATWDWANGEAAAVAVTTAWVNGVIGTFTPFLTTQAYINSQIPFRDTQAAVNADQANYVNATQEGAASGIATLAGTGYVTASQVPTNISTDNIVQCYNASSAGVVNLTSTHNVTTNNPTEYTAATINVPDPGYPYIPFPFVYVQGQAIGSQSGRQFGTGNSGMIAVMTPSGFSTTNVYAIGICTASPHLNFYTALPTANVVVSGGQIQLPTAPPITPLVTPAINGPLTLNANLSCFTGNNYQFSGTGFQFFCLTMPSI